jgi:hypothetical protein
MARGVSRAQDQGAEKAGSQTLRPLRPWVEAGWIFKDDEIIVIERQGSNTRSRKVSAEVLTG